MKDLREKITEIIGFKPKLTTLQKVDEILFAVDSLGIIDLGKLKRQIEEADKILETLQALYRSETGVKHKWFK